MIIISFYTVSYTHLSVDTRELALEMLIEINERGAFSHIVLRSVLDKIGRAHV